jgi:Ring finger domain
MEWKTYKMVDSSEICVICQRRFCEKKQRRKIIFESNCGHIFHNDCLSKYCDSKNDNHVKCPLCNYEFHHECESTWAFKNDAMNIRNLEEYADPTIVKYYKGMVISRGLRNTSLRTTDSIPTINRISNNS